jgi:hypothetical protein
MEPEGSLPYRQQPANSIRITIFIIYIVIHYCIIKDISTNYILSNYWINCHLNLCNQCN